MQSSIFFYILAYIAFLVSSYFFKRFGINDKAEKAFSSNLKGMASKNFSGGSVPRPPFYFLHLTMDPGIGDQNQGLQ